jgi:hypothetical protein
MSRGLTTGFLNAADAGTVYPALLTSFDFSGAQINLWTGFGSLSYGSLTYAGIGDLGGISAIEESQETQANGLSFNLNGIPSAMVSSILSENYRNRVCTVSLALFASLTATSPITAPATMFVGRMDQAIMNDDGETATINLTAESRLIDLQRPRARRYTDEDQRGNASYTADLGLQYIAGLQDKELMWGAHNSAPMPINDDGRGFGGEE